MKARSMLVLVALSAFLFAAGAIAVSETTLPQVVKTYLHDLQGTLDPGVINLLF